MSQPKQFFTALVPHSTNRQRIAQYTAQFSQHNQPAKHSNMRKTRLTQLKRVAGLMVLATLAWSSFAQAAPALTTVDSVKLDRYLGLWHEVARKPMYFERNCARDITARYTLNENGNIKVDNRCVKADGQVQQSVGEAFIQNPPKNTQLKVSFLPEIIRWIPVARGDYWILKLDDNYQTALVGEPSRKYLWVLSRDPKPDAAVVDSYLKYAESLGYSLDDIIRAPQTGR